MGTVLRFKTKPRPYQLPALKKLLKHGGGGLYVPMRWGKTWVAVNLCAGWHLREGIQRVLVICPNDVISVWEGEIALHCPVEWSIIEDVENSNPRGLEFHIRNFESVFAREMDGRDWTGISDGNLLAWKPQVVIVDEAHHIGNPSALQSKKTVEVGKLAQHRVFLTGTPFHRKPFYVFGQFRFYDESVLGGNFGAFKRMIAIFGGYNNYEVIRYINLKWLRNKIRPHVFISKKVPKAPAVKRRILFSMDESKAKYREMEHESIIKVGEDEITAPIVLTRQLRLQQIAGGWVKTEDGRYKRVGSEKQRAFARRVKEYREQGITKFVVGARFIPELRDIYHVVRDAGYTPLLVHGAVDRRERQSRRERFNAQENVVFIAQFQAAREGIDLSTADLMVYYSLPGDYLTYDQFGARIEKYRETRTLLYEHLVVKGTRDEIAWEAISRQEDVAKYIMSHPHRVERLTEKP